MIFDKDKFTAVELDLINEYVDKNKGILTKVYRNLRHA